VLNELTELEWSASWLPARVTYLLDGQVLETYEIKDAGVLTVPAYGPQVVCLIEFGDGTVAARRIQPS
jgi:hypothetical protein